MGARRLVFGVLFFTAAVTIACARQGPCSADEAKLADTEAETLRDWDSLYKSYSQFDNCDDGAIAEGYSESVARILVNHWDTLPRLAELAKSTPAFRAFVVKHVDPTLNTDDLKKIAELAKTHCPNGLRELCGDLKKQVH